MVDELVDEVLLGFILGPVESHPSPARVGTPGQMWDARPMAVDLRHFRSFVALRKR
jgi:hypothetical protein